MAEKFAELVTTRAKGGVRIMRAPSQTGEPSGPRAAPDETPRENKPDFHRRKFEKPGFDKKKKFGGKKKFDKRKPGAQSN